MLGLAPLTWKFFAAVFILLSSDIDSLLAIWLCNAARLKMTANVSKFTLTFAEGVERTSGGKR